MVDDKTSLIKEYFHKVKAANKEAFKDSLNWLFSNPPLKELTATRLGKLRLDIKKHLSAEMKEIDRLVKNVVG